MLDTIFQKLLGHYNLLLVAAVLLWLVLTGYGGYRLFFARWRKILQVKILQEQINERNMFLSERLFGALLIIIAAVMLGFAIAYAPAAPDDSQNQAAVPHIVASFG